MKSQIFYSKATLKSNISLSTEGFSPLNNSEHNHQKKRFISLENNLYLQKLGVINFQNIVNKNKVGKMRQIHKFIETLNSTIKKSSLNNQKTISIIDMGSGKGYLTFAMYDYLQNILQKKTALTGVEFRKDLVKICNTISDECDFSGLDFIEGTIQDYNLEKNDILIALHACNTATDDAIYKGIQSKSEIIILSPCCHKQIRKEISKNNILADILKHGILKERQAEMITDTLRGLFLELHGYKTQIFEYISDEHTHKNIMIVGVKKNLKINSEKILRKISDLKSVFGIERFYLEELFENK